MIGIQSLEWRTKFLGHEPRLVSLREEAPLLAFAGVEVRRGQ